MRTKIIAGNLATVLLVGLVSYAMVKSSLETSLVGEVDSRIGSDFRLLERSFRLSARDLAELVGEQASQRALTDTFLSALDETSRRTRAYEAADRTAAWLADPARRGAAPDIVVVLDNRGRVVARNADRNRMYQQEMGAVPAVARALQGETTSGIWEKEDEHKVLQIAVAPITSEGRNLGALLVGYDLSNGLASAEGGLLGRDVAFALGDRVYSSSLEQGAESEALGAHLFGAGQGATTAALEQGLVSPGFRVTLAGADYVGVIGPAPAGGSATQLAMIVLANRSAQVAKASAANVILLLMIVGVLIVVVYGFLIGTSLLKPIEVMEEAVLAVINGRTETRIDVQSAELGGLAYRINQLLNVFTGTPEEDDQGRVSSPPGARWQDDGIGQGAAESASGSAPEAAAAPAADADVEDPALAAQLAGEPEDTYYARVYGEYVAAKQSVGEDVSNIPQDKFVQRLRANEQGLIKKHNCRMVRFQVQTRGTQVNLKPVVIR